jgi:peptidoglycan/xylan/chitin deacetylase (PgdA/CDA1 family)
VSTGRRLALGALALGGAYWGPGLAAVPSVGRRLGRWVLTAVSTEEPAVALTFDDGPDPRFAERFLEALGQARCTFFWLGSSVRRWPDLARAARAAGHEIACHGDTHHSMGRAGPVGTARSLRAARDAIGSATGRAPAFYRPPYGWFTAPAWTVCERLGLRRTLWTASAGDWRSDRSSAQIAQATLAAVRPGAILLLHDGRGQNGAPLRTLAAVPAILQGLSTRGLRPVTLSELVRLGMERPAAQPGMSG